MSREDISFKMDGNVTLRGWFYKPKNSTDRLPCLVMAHGFSGVKEMDLDLFADRFTSSLPLSCLVYDNWGFGASDTRDGAPRQEIIPAQQTSDHSDPITYVQMRDDVDQDRIGVWGTSCSGGHVLWVGAVDRRVKAVLYRHARAAGKPTGTIPVVDENPLATSALPTPDSFTFLNAWEQKSSWKNEVTVKSIEALREYNPSAHIQNIAPTPLLMTVAQKDVLCPTPLALEAYSRALEPKQLHILPGGHFDGYSGLNFDRNSATQIEFLNKWLCK